MLLKLLKVAPIYWAHLSRAGVEWVSKGVDQRKGGIVVQEKVPLARDLPGLVVIVALHLDVPLQVRRRAYRLRDRLISDLVSTPGEIRQAVPQVLQLPVVVGSCLR